MAGQRRSACRSRLSRVTGPGLFKDDIAYLLEIGGSHPFPCDAQAGSRSYADAHSPIVHKLNARPDGLPVAFPKH